MYHPADPARHEMAMVMHLQEASTRLERAENERYRARYERAALNERWATCAMELACESAEEAAILSGREFSLLPSFEPLPKYNDFWRRY